MRNRALLLLALSSLLACGAPSAPNGVAESSIDDPHQCTEYGFAKVSTLTDWSKDCGDPASNIRDVNGNPTGPILQMSVLFNCRTPNQDVWHQRYDWFQCLNKVQHPSGGQGVVTWSPGCILVNGICTIGQLPSDPTWVDADSPDGLLLRALVAKLEDARVQLKAQGGSDLNDRLKLLDAAQLFGDLADAAFLKDKRLLGVHSVSTALRLVDLAVNFVPGVALARDAITVLTGTNPITGEAVGDVERAMIAATLLVPSFLEGGAHGLVELGEALEGVAASSRAESSAAADLLSALERSDAEVADLVNALPCTIGARLQPGHGPEPLAKRCSGLVGEFTAEAAAEGQRVLGFLRDGEVGVGDAVRKDYAKTFRDSFAYVSDEVGQVHHAIEQQVLDRYPGLFSEQEINSLENLRGIPDGPDGTPCIRARFARRGTRSTTRG
jgi:hypothetical protein